MGSSNSKSYHILIGSGTNRTKTNNSTPSYIFYWPYASYHSYCTSKRAALQMLDKFIKEDPKKSYQLVWYVPVKNRFGQIQGITGDATIIGEYHPSP